MKNPRIDATMEEPGDSTATPLYQVAELAVKSEATERVEALDVLRGFMALAVAVYHLHTWTHVFGRGTLLASVVAVLGLYSVQGFFLVSGFCFFHLYRGTTFDRTELARFHVRRFLRIAPLYYVAVLLNLVLAQPVAMSQFNAERLVENLTLSFGLFHPNHAYVLGGWSIGVEYVFYLAFPLLALVTRRAFVLYGVALAALALGLWFTFHTVAEAPEPQRFNAYVRVANHGFLFLFGGVIADLRRRTSLRLPAPVFVVALVALSFVAYARQPVFYDHFEAVLGHARVEHLAQCFALALLFAFFAPKDGWLLRPFTWLGDLSYATYLLHPFAYLAVSKVVGDDRPRLAFALGLGATLAMAALSYRLLERPAIELGRRLTARRSARAA